MSGQDPIVAFQAAIADYWTALEATHGPDNGEWCNCARCDMAAWNLAFAALDLDNALDHPGTETPHG